MQLLKIDLNFVDLNAYNTINENNKMLYYEFIFEKLSLHM